MKKYICILLYKVGLFRLAYRVSPSTAGHLFGKELGKRIKAAIEKAEGTQAVKGGEVAVVPPE